MTECNGVLFAGASECCGAMVGAPGASAASNVAVHCVHPLAGGRAIPAPVGHTAGSCAQLEV